MTYPLQPTERDRERFRDHAKSIGIEGEVTRGAKNGTSALMFMLWWSVEKERQLLHNLNQSQGAEISRLMNKIKQLEAL